MSVPPFKLGAIISSRWRLPPLEPSVTPSVQPSSSSDRDHDQRIADQLRASGPMNLARAYEIMDRFDLQGLVLGDPLNVFHVLGYWPQIANTKTGQPPTSFALLSRDESLAPGFVTTRFIYYYTYADGQFRRDVQAYLYLNAADAGDAAPGEPVQGDFPDRGAAPLSPVEHRRRLTLDAAVAARGSFADAGGALAGAMRDMGLWRGRIAFDHPVIAAVCARRDHPGELIPADNVLRWIRLIKSSLEIALMRRASAANVEAVSAVGQTIRAGADYGDLRQVFEVEAAKRGNRAVFMTVDRVSSDLADESIVDGQTLFIDGVSHRHHYHGDYARTVFVGEPRAKAREAARAAAHGWNAVRERLRPGLRYSELVAIGQDAVRKGGFGVTVGFGPHSVGLMHNDEPGEDLGGFYGQMDLTLQENMIISVDCPVMDTGYGGSAHIEDLMRITADGAVPIHAVGEPVIVV
jgi:Xaa-Pro aminopeptidase